MDDPTTAALMVVCKWLNSPPSHHEHQNVLMTHCRMLRQKIHKLNKQNVEAHYQIKYLEDRLMWCQTAYDHLIHVLRNIHYQVLNAQGLYGETFDAYVPF